jgi:hypothetical protein
MASRQTWKCSGLLHFAYLLDGPKPQTALDGHVPISVREQLRSAGIIKRKRLLHGSVATAWWYMADEEASEVQVPSTQSLPRCDDPGIFDVQPRADKWFAQPLDSPDSLVPGSFEAAKGPGFHRDPSSSTVERVYRWLDILRAQPSRPRPLSNEPRPIHGRGSLPPESSARPPVPVDGGVTTAGLVGVAVAFTAGAAAGILGAAGFTTSLLGGVFTTGTFTSGVLVGVAVGATSVGVFVGVAVGATAVGVLVGVLVGSTGVLVGVAVDVIGVGVDVGVLVGVRVGVFVAVGVKVGVGVGVTITQLTSIWLRPGQPGPGPIRVIVALEVPTPLTV